VGSLALLTCLGPLAACEPAESVADGERGAQAYPERVVATWTEDPATGFRVTWRDWKEVDPLDLDSWTGRQGLRAQIRAADSSIPPVGSTDEVPSELHAVLTDYTQPGGGTEPLLPPRAHYSVAFTGLTADRIYQYRVGEPGSWSPWFHFRTAADPGASAGRPPQTFVFLGDIQEGIHDWGGRAFRVAIRAAPRALAILHGGDQVDDGGTEQQWGEWFDAGGATLAEVAQLPAAGNNEHPRDGSGRRTLTPAWDAHFGLPSTGPDGPGSPVYTVAANGIRFLVLDSSAEPWIQEQTEWMREVLGNAAEDWVIALFHHPLFSVRGRDNQALREAWMPVFQEYGVDLVLQGHNHLYARSGLVEGSVYVISNAGAKMNPVEREDSRMVSVAEGEQRIQVIRVEDERLEYQSCGMDERVKDAFLLVRTKDGDRALEDLEIGGPCGWGDL